MIATVSAENAYLLALVAMTVAGVLLLASWVASRPVPCSTDDPDEPLSHVRVVHPAYNWADDPESGVL